MRRQKEPNKIVKIIKEGYQSHNINFGKKMDISFEDLICGGCGKSCSTVMNAFDDINKEMKFYYARCLKCNKEYYYND